MRLAKLALLPLVATACQPGAGEESTQLTLPSTATATATLTATTDPATEEDSGPETGDGDGNKLDLGEIDVGAGLEVAEVFGHSGDTLYRLDPDTLEVAIVGPLSGCTGSIIDIALDADSNMYGTAFGSLWSIDRETGACTVIAPSGDYTTSLSFVPAGTVDPNVEALVGFDEDEYLRIDTQTGALTTLGFLTDGLASSGDMVSVIGGGTYLTVTGDAPPCDTTDCIVEIDPSTGAILQNYGSVGYDQVFGLAFWGGRAYGFARDGVLFEIEFAGDAVISTPIPIPMAPQDLEFYGAGSTTSAPPIEG